MNIHFKKIIAIIIIIIIIPIFLTGCTRDARGIENLAYVTGISFDIGKENLIILTFQFADLSSGVQEGSSQPKSSTLVSVDCSSFENGLSMINSYISKKVNLSHCKIIVFSEEIAVTGISNHINDLASNLEVRPDCDILVSKCDGKAFLENSIPSLTNLTARYYEILLNSKDYTGFSNDTPLWKFLAGLKNTTIEPVAVLCGLNRSYINPLVENKSLLDKDVSYKAGEMPLSGKTLSQYSGLAVFSHDKMVGELTPIECISYLMLTNSLETCDISIPNPFEDNSAINLRLELNKNTKNKVKLVNKSPFIETNVYIIASITAVSLSTDYSKLKHINIIEDYVSSYIESNISNLLYKTSKYYKSDVVGFGKNLTYKFLTIDDWKKLNWSDLYKDSFFKVKVETKIKSGSLFIKN